MLIKFFTVLSFISLTNCLSFSGETDKRIRKCLLGSLNRSYRGLKPLVSEIPSIRCSTDKDDYPFDFMNKIFSEFLGFKSLNNLALVNVFYNDSLKVSVLTRLIAFHPHFATEDVLVNTLLFSVLNEHFENVPNTECPLIHDHIQLFTAKFYFNELDFNLIPRNIYYYLICFIHEIIYETDLHTPATLHEFLNRFVCSLRISEHSLEQTYKYVLSKYRTFSRIDSSSIPGYEPESSSSSDSDSAFYDESDIFNDKSEKSLLVLSESRDNLLFFYSNPSLESIKERFRIGAVFNPTDMPDLRPEFQVAILSAFLHVLDSSSLESAYNIFNQTRTYYYSFELVNMMALNSKLASHVEIGKYHSVALETHENLNNSDIFGFSERLASINPKNLLDPAVFDEKDLELVDFSYAVVSQPYSLSKLEAISALNSEKLLNLRVLIEMQEVKLHDIICELLVKESTQYLSVSLVQYIFRQSSKNATFNRLFLAHLGTYHPFRLLHF